MSVDTPAREGCSLPNLAAEDPDDRLEGWETGADDANADLDGGPKYQGGGGPCNLQFPPQSGQWDTMERA